MTKETVFITGGAGFIGRSLVEKCINSGKDVVVYDNFSTGSIENLAPYIDQIRIYEADILDQQKISEAIKESKPTILFHLAAHHYIPYCNEHPVETLQVNVIGTYLVLKNAAEHGVKLSIVASSGAIYPDLDKPLSEDIIPEPMDIYGVSKFLSEKVSEYISMTTNLNVIVARIFNTYGPHERTPHLITHIIKSLQNSSVIELGNLNSKRDYIYVEDVANALMEISAKVNNHKYIVLNIGTGQEYSAMEIIQILRELIGLNIEVVSVLHRRRKVDKLHQIADISKIYKLTSWLPKYSLKQGLVMCLKSEGLL